MTLEIILSFIGKTLLILQRHSSTVFYLACASAVLRMGTQVSETLGTARRCWRNRTEAEGIRLLGQHSFLLNSIDSDSFSASPDLSGDQDYFSLANYCKLYTYLLSKFSLFFKDFIYLFLERGKGRRKRGREKSMCKRNIISLLLQAPNWEPGQNQVHGNLVTFHFAG